MLRVDSSIHHFGLAVGSLPFVHPMVHYIYKSPRNDTEVSKQRRVTEYDIEDITTWYQTFGSTATIFGGVGGAAMTRAMMVVIKTKWYYIVFCNGVAVYMVPIKPENDIQLFLTDMQNKRLNSLRYAPEQYGAEVAPDLVDFYKSLKESGEA